MPAVRRFVGIELKYHKGLGDPPAPLWDRDDEIAAAMGVFRPEARDLSATPGCLTFTARQASSLPDGVSRACT